MSAIRSKNTRPETMLRKLLHRMGFRYRLHARGVPGKPDMVFRPYRAALFVHGCFWHGHDCDFFRMPTTRPEFWAAKIAQNRARDIRVRQMLVEAGWRVAVVWECALRGQSPAEVDRVAARISGWLKSSRRTLVIRQVCRRKDA